MPNLTVLNVAEKHDAAKRLSQIMSNGNCHRREGFSKFNKIFEFNYDILNSNCNMIMTSVSGHLGNIAFSQGFKKWNQCNPVALFDAPIVHLIPDSYKDIQRTLQREVRKCQVLIIWTDGDREGENIGFEIINVCREVKPNIRLYRAKFSEITPRAVHLATQNLVAPDENVSNAVEVRKELDLRIGASFTRLQTLRLSKRFPNVLSDQVISYGSCQFPTLGFVVERYQQVQEFIPETFYKIRVIHEKDDTIAEFSWQRGRLFIQRICAIFCNMCQENSEAKVVKVTSKPKSRWRPVPLDTVELEKTASRKLKINAKETMTIAEKLYNKGIISYPRTETNIFPKGMNLSGLVENQIQDPQWGTFAAGILQNGGPNPRQGRKTDNAHPPIHPLKFTDTLQGNEKRLYEFIVRHFLACLSQDAQGKETSVEIEIAGEYFSTHGLVIIARNYLEVYCYETWNAKNIPNYVQEEIFLPNNIEMLNGETQAPPLLSEADLIALMEKHGIGTDATHADHIEKIKERQYVGVQQDGTFLPGKLGMGLVEGYDEMGFAMSKPHLRARLEADLKCICEGTKNKDVVLAEQIRNYKEVFEQAAIQIEKLDLAVSHYFGAMEDVPENQFDPVLEPIQKCRKCNVSDIVLRKSKENCWFIGCMGYPDCKNSTFFPSFVLNVEKSNAVCSLCEPKPVYKLIFEFKRGSVPAMMISPYTACVGGCDEMIIGLLGNNKNRETDQTSRQTRQNCNSSIDKRIPINRSSNSIGRQRNIPPPKKKKKKGDTQLVQQNVRRGSNTVQPNQVNHSPHQRNTSFTNDNDENVVVCDCALPAMSLTVKKSGPNLGRPFYKCGSPSNSCKFFLWIDSSSSQASNSSNSTTMAGMNNSMQIRHSPYRQNNVTDMDEVKCNCNGLAISRTVNKEGPNKGRQFYCCMKPIDQGCGFFKWVDDIQGVSGNSSSTFGNHAQTFTNGNNRSDTSFNTQGAGQLGGNPDTDVSCNCNVPAIVRTVNKDGMNKGRKFYCCSKPRDQQCGFFKWSDDNEDTTSVKKKRKCGMCGQVGHTKKTCPFSK